MVCEFKKCGRKVFAKGLCVAHYRQRSRGLRLRALMPPSGRRLPDDATVQINTRVSGAVAMRLEQMARRRNQSRYEMLSNVLTSLASP